MANHALPTTTSLYTDVLTNIKDRIDDSLKMLDSVNTSPTNVPTNSIRWNSTTTLWEKYDGSSWISLAASYAIKVLKSTNLVGGNGTTLLGSIPYQSGTDTTTLLAPNTTTTRKFLRQTGTGTNGGAPVWDTILASDIPTLNQNTTGSSGSCTGNSATATTANSLNESNSYTGFGFTANGGAFRTQNWGSIPTNGVVYFGNAESYIFKSGGAWYFNNQQGFNNVLGTNGNIVTANGGTWSINATTATSAGSCTGNSATATKLNNSANDWSASGAIASVVGMLSWKNFGNGHVIFDASNGTAPNGTAVNNTNSTVPWSPTYPTLMGWNGGQTYGVRVDSARVADYVTNTIGYGQTWQDVTSSRVAGTTYTNSTGKPIFVLLAFYNDISVYLDAIPAFMANNEGLANATSNISIVIPNGSTYKFTSSYGIIKWLELR